MRSSPPCPPWRPRRCRESLDNLHCSLRSPPTATHYEPRRPTALEHNAVEIDIRMFALNRPIAPGLEIVQPSITSPSDPAAAAVGSGHSRRSYTWQSSVNGGCAVVVQDQGGLLCTRTYRTVSCRRAPGSSGYGQAKALVAQSMVTGALRLVPEHIVVRFRRRRR
jgi:hypothetical protein